MDREKIIKDLEECLSASCRGFRPRLSCPYNDEEWDIMRDALELLKEDCHNCKLECLLQKYDKLKEKHDKLLKEHTDETKELRSMVEFWKEKALHT